MTSPMPIILMDTDLKAVSLVKEGGYAKIAKKEKIK